MRILMGTGINLTVVHAPHALKGGRTLGSSLAQRSYPLILTHAPIDCDQDRRLYFYFKSWTNRKIQR
jgi:hypothetical protein